MKSIIKLTFLAVFLLISNKSVDAQIFPASPDTLERELEEITIEATRGLLSNQNAPFSVSQFSRSREDLEFEPALSLDRSLNRLPGLWTNDRNNYALGERMSIRGMGWRAAFGVRGIYVMMDGIPLTVPDGQTVLDLIDPAFIQSAEIIRGPSSAFWGNAGGGTLFLSTRNFTSEPSGYARTYAGSFATYKAEAGASTQYNGNFYQFFSSYTSREGFRDHSSFQALRFGGNAEFGLSQTSSLGLSFAFVDAPDVRHPGSLNNEQANEEPSAANPLFVNAEAGKTWQQGQIGLTYNNETNFGLLTVTGYGLYRDLHNPLPFNDIEVDRIVSGARFTLQDQFQFVQWGVGIDAAIQRDERRNFDYAEGFQRNEITLEQTETVTNTAFFLQLSTTFERFNVHTATRFDNLRFENEDQFLINGDQSGSRNFSAISPSFGLSFSHDYGLIYTNLSSAFESPTTTELVNRPDMTGGFNPDIDPERTIGVELGARGRFYRNQLMYDVAVFSMDIENRLIPFQTEDGGDRVFYSNEGSTNHRGLELTLQWNPNQYLELFTGYTWSQFLFEDAQEDLVDNFLPGIPEHRFYGSIETRLNQFYLNISAQFVDSYYTDSINTSKNDSYFVSDLTLGLSQLELVNNLKISPFIQVTNLTNTRYNSSVSINANFGRYYEPAPPRGIYGGFTLRFG